MDLSIDTQFSYLPQLPRAKCAEYPCAEYTQFLKLQKKKKKVLSTTLYYSKAECSV